MEWKFEYLILAPLAWSLLQGVQHGKMINAMHAQLSVLQNNVSMLNTKFDVFLKSEIDALKDIAESIRDKK